MRRVMLYRIDLAQRAEWSPSIFRFIWWELAMLKVVESREPPVLFFEGEKPLRGQKARSNKVHIIL